MSLLAVVELVLVLEVEVLEHIELELHQYQQDHQMQFPYRLVPVALNSGERFPQAFQPQTMLEHHLISEHP